jgi:hypothetical protein
VDDKRANRTVRGGKETASSGVNCTIYLLVQVDNFRMADHS